MKYFDDIMNSTTVPEPQSPQQPYTISTNPTMLTSNVSSRATDNDSSYYLSSPLHRRNSLQPIIPPSPFLHRNPLPIIPSQSPSLHRNPLPIIPSPLLLPLSSPLPLSSSPLRESQQQRQSQQQLSPPMVDEMMIDTLYSSSRDDDNDIYSGLDNSTSTISRVSILLLKGDTSQFWEGLGSHDSDDDHDVRSCTNSHDSTIAWLRHDNNNLS